MQNTLEFSGAEGESQNGPGAEVKGQQMEWR